jgi:hypothetical protein
MRKCEQKHVSATAGPRVEGRVSYRDAAAKLAAELLERRGIETDGEKSRQFWHERRKREEQEAAEAWDAEEQARKRRR